MAHWLDKIVDILTADTDDLRKLARIAGYDPKEFYRGTLMNGADLRGQDLTGMEFTDLDLSAVKYDQKTRVSASRFRDFDAAPEMIVVPAGEFMMGSVEGEGNTNEWPQHKVRIAKPLAIGIAPVTRGEFAAFVKATNYPMVESWQDPGFDQRDDHPVVNVDWKDAKAYATWLKKKSRKAYRLLSEAEWEYCCRAGSTSAYNTGDTITAEQANFRGATEGTTSVFKFPPNAWGVYDMHGNVCEWCEDYWHENYNGDPPADGSAWQGRDASFRVLRGGSWRYYRQLLRSAYRFRDRPDDRVDGIGFRVARTL